MNKNICQRCGKVTDEPLVSLTNFKLKTDSVEFDRIRSTQICSNCNENDPLFKTIEIINNNK